MWNVQVSDYDTGELRHSFQCKTKPQAIGLAATFLDQAETDEPSASLRIVFAPKVKK